MSYRWEPNSFGYHGDDGRKYSANWKGEPYAAGFSTGTHTFVHTSMTGGTNLLFCITSPQGSMQLCCSEDAVSSDLRFLFAQAMLSARACT
eukprot:2023247-Pyramimonas_sp.AAC.1